MIDGNISDLFFNTDVNVAAEHDLHGNFTGYNETKLRNEAEMFLACLDRLNVAIPTIDELLADFHGRA